MKVAGIIAEYNPFHNGHKLHVAKTKEICDAQYVVAVMSGNFLQRGEPSLFNKWSRAKAAILGGVDLVIELPTVFSVRSARNFAYGAVSLLHSTGIIDYLSFGSEHGSLTPLKEIAQVLHEEPQQFKQKLVAFLDQGLSYPTAQAKAISEVLSDESSEAMDLISSPNNILAIEYLRALQVIQSDIQPITIQRAGAGYLEKEWNPDSQIASATAIREAMRKGILPNGVVPTETLNIIREDLSLEQGPVFSEHYTKILFYILRTITPNQLAQLHEVTEGLENRLIEKALAANTLEDFISAIKTKRYTRTRLQRILTYILLGIKKDMVATFDNLGPQYIRVLAMSEFGRELVKKMKKAAQIPVITRTSPILKKGGPTAEMLALDIKATDIYTILYPSSKVPRAGLDLKTMPFILDSAF